MWIASVYGFFSIVKKDNGFHVRARSYEDALALATAAGGFQVEKDVRADYHYRFIVDVAGYAKVMTVLMRSVKYPNFKAEIGKTYLQADKLPIYHRIWAMFHDYQSVPAKGGKRGFKIGSGF